MATQDSKLCPEQCHPSAHCPFREKAAQRRHCERATGTYRPGTRCSVGAAVAGPGRARESLGGPGRATQHSHVSRFARGDQMSSPETAVALQEAWVEPAREAKVHTQHQEKRNETHYCSIVGHGHMGSLETEVVSAWARQGLRWKPLLRAYTETTARSPGIPAEQEGWSGQAGGLSTKKTQSYPGSTGA